MGGFPAAPDPSAADFIAESPEFLFRGDPLDGIFAHSVRALHRSPVQSGLVRVIPCDSACVYVESIFTSAGARYWHSHDRPLRGLGLQFIGCRVLLTGYALQSAPIGVPRSWALDGAAVAPAPGGAWDWEALSALAVWEAIDEVRDERALTIAGAVKYFDCEAERPFSFFRLRQLESNGDSRATDFLGLRRVELFGRIVAD
jgi:hypothetical protein